MKEASYYREKISKAASANKMTATCPPSWDADEIATGVLEEKAGEFEEIYKTEPSALAEILGYDKEIDRKLCSQLQEAIQTTQIGQKVSDTLIFDISVTLEILIATRAQQAAERWLNHGE